MSNVLAAGLGIALPFFSGAKTRTGRPAPSLNRSVAVLIACVALVGLQALLAAPLVPDIAQGLGASIADIGQALGAYGAMAALSALFLGPLADRFKRGQALVAGLIGLIGGLALCASAVNWMIFAAGQALMGAAAGVVLPTAYASAGDLAPAERRSAILGRVLLGWSVALILGVPLAGLLGQVIGWRGVFAGLGLPVLVALPVAFALPDPRTERGTGQGLMSRLGTAVRVPGVLPMLAVGFLNMTAFYGTYAYLGTAVRAALHGGSAVGAIPVLAYGTGFTITAFISPLIDRIGPRRVLPVAALALIGIFLTLPSVVGILPALVVVMVCFGFIQHLVLNSFIGLLSVRGGAQRGVVLALNTAGTYIGLMIGTASMGRVLDAVGFTPVTATSAALMVVAGGIALWDRRRA